MNPDDTPLHPDTLAAQGVGETASPYRDIVPPLHPATTFERAGDGVRLVLTDGTSTEYGGAFIATQLSQAAPFAEQLGLTLLPSGCVEVDPMGRTSLPGVHAAGDMAHVAELPMPMSSVLVSAAAGQAAAGAMVAHLL